ncbi:hypothetical protein BRADI_3g03010v3 [Brachypodium distachyon]|nr:hypothetical protein BRADI_3g03010v3 [Brachypodium distachyon]
MLCHRFYLLQSHVKNEWQTIATACILLASKIEDTPCSLKRVVIAAYETMYRRKPDTARRIHEKEFLEKRKSLVVVGERLLLSTIRFDFNIQHPYGPLNCALENLGISQKEVQQAAVNLIHDALRSTLVVQFKPHYIAAASLFLAAKREGFKLPLGKGKVWWQQFDVAPQQLEAAVSQMREVCVKRKPGPTVPAVRPTPDPTPVEKQPEMNFPKPVLKYVYSRRPQSRPAPAGTPTLVEKQQIISTVDPVLRPTQSSGGDLSRPTAVPTATPTLVEKEQIIRSVGAVLKPTNSSGGGPSEPTAVPTATPDVVEKQQIISTPDSVLRHADPSRGGLSRHTTAPTVTPETSTLAKKQQKISTPDSVLRHTHPSKGGLSRPTTSATRDSTLVKKQQVVSTLESVQSHAHPSRRGLTSNNFDREAPRRMGVDRLVHHNSTGSSVRNGSNKPLPRNEDNKPLRRHMDLGSNRTVRDERSEKQSSQSALKADHVHGEQKDIDVARVRKRRIQEDGEHPTPVDRSDQDSWTGQHIQSVMVVEPKLPSLKRHKI